jgi:hypothetical protein
MPAIDKVALKRLVERVFSLNGHYKQLLGVDANNQALGPPASDRKLTELEDWIGMRLPPSYRLFLSMYNGWRGFEGNVCLLSIDEQRLGTYADYVREWKQARWEEGEGSLVDGIVIGIKVYGNTAVIIDTSRVDQNGEMQLVVWRNFETERDANFIELLRNKENILERLIAQEESQKHR